MPFNNPLQAALEEQIFEQTIRLQGMLAKHYMYVSDYNEFVKQRELTRSLPAKALEQLADKPRAYSLALQYLVEITSFEKTAHALKEKGHLEIVNVLVSAAHAIVNE